MRRDVDVPYTCGNIDEVIAIATRVMYIIHEADDRELSERCEHLLDQVEEYMEIIRSDNSDLRSYAETYADEANVFEERVEELEDTLARKDEVILALEEKIFDAEKEIADAQHLYQPVWSYGQGAS